MTSHPDPTPAPADRFTTLRFTRHLDAPATTLWQAWTAPAARVLWAPPAPNVTVEFLEADTRPAGREVSLCKVAGQPDIRCEVGWLHLDAPHLSINHEVISCEGVTQSIALITAEVAAVGTGSRLDVTVQLASVADDMAAGYQQGYGAGLDNLADVAARTMVLERVIKAPRHIVWGAWVNPQTLPQWWGPDGFSCRTERIDLRTGGEWVFDMIGPDGTIYPNHHRYGLIRPQDHIAYALLMGENGPRHADAWIAFADEGDATRVTLGMVLSSAAAYQAAEAMGARPLGFQTLGKLARFIGAD
jgi:uncharacterized protein YndB with AHSA1/START domain